MKIENNILLELTDADVIDGHIEIPDQVTEIADNVNAALPELRSIAGENVVRIGGYFLFYNKSATKLHFPNLTTAGDCFLYYNKSATKLHFPNLTTAGDCFLFYNESATKLHFPNLTTAGGRFLFYNESATKLHFPKLTTAGDDFLVCNESTTKLHFPKLTTAGDDFLYYNRSATELHFPKLTTAGNDFLFYNKSATKLHFPNLTTAGDNFLFRNESEITIEKKKIRRIDGLLFESHATKVRKGVTVHSGLILSNLTNGIWKETPACIAEKDGFFAHGDTEREAINDLDFKILSQGFEKKEIYADTPFGVNEYRLYTGACRLGVRHFLHEHKIKAKKTYKASEILPKLKQLNAYGINDVYQWVRF